VGRHGYQLALDVVSIQQFSKEARPDKVSAIAMLCKLPGKSSDILAVVRRK